MMLTFLAAALAASPARTHPCRAQVTALRLDDAGGDFTGMSHAGTYVMLTNRGRSPCTLPALPPITLRDARGAVLPIERQVPLGIRPGPMMVPMTLRPRATAATGLRWVSGPVYDRSRCYDVGSIAVEIDGATRRQRLIARICGPEGGRLVFEQPPLRAGE